MKRTFSTLILALSLTAVSLSASARPFGPNGPDGPGSRGPGIDGPAMPGGELLKFARHLEFLADELQISGQQLTQIDVVLDAARVELRTLRRALSGNRNALREAAEFDSYDAGRVAELAAEQGQLTEQMIILITRVRADVLAVLTAEQRAQLAQLRQRRMGG